jgi:pheromone shutdown protein TraB
LKTGIEDTASLNRRFVKVKDFESLLDDISSFKGFWRNKITRILLVVVFTNLGASLGTFVAIPLMLKVL